MASPTQFRHYHISQDAEGRNIEVLRSDEQVGVLAFDAQRLVFVHCHVVIDPLGNQQAFEELGRKVAARGDIRLARLVEIGEDDGNPFYITENVDGETIEAYLSRRDEVPLWLAMRLSTLSLDCARAVLEAGLPMARKPLEDFRLVQTGPRKLEARVADYHLTSGAALKAAKAKVAQAPFQKQAQLLHAWFSEQVENGGESTDAALVRTEDFLQLLQPLLASCTAGLEDRIGALIDSLEKVAPAAPAGELAAALKPRPLIAPYLATFQEVARSVVQHVRIQSQKLDAGQPYAMRGIFLKTGQQVVVEQVPFYRLAGGSAHETLTRVKNLPKSGKYPNLVPVIFSEEHEDVECMAELAVEGVTLREVLDVRRTLDSQEAYLVLAGVDAAVSQLEKAGLSARRIRLEDIFLFTGFAKENPRETGLLSQKLNEWPGFSIVLRVHPSLHAMTCRGTDPAIRLPVFPQHTEADEPIWNGAWMAALGCFLVGVPLGTKGMDTGIPETDTVFRLLADEVGKAFKSKPSTRAAFLSRFARVMQQFDLAQFSRSGGFWTELSGSATAQGHAAEVARAASLPPVSAPAASPPLASLVAPLPAASPPSHKKTTSAAMPVHRPVGQPIPGERPAIGFAEALLQERSAAAPTRTPQGLRTMGHDLDLDSVGVESSWQTMHEKSPLWVRLLMLLVGSMVLGAVLAHWSGRALWQSVPVLPLKPAMETAPAGKSEMVDLPVAPSPASPAPTASAPVGPASAPQGNTAPPPQHERNVGDSAVPRAVPVGDEPELTSRLIRLRQDGVMIPANMRDQVATAAGQGNAEAMLALGQLYLRGAGGVMPNEKTAYDWFQKAHHADLGAAALPLAECYLQGWGTAIDTAQAVSLLTKASGAGDAKAKDLLAVCYARGIGVNQDDVKAFQLCTEAYRAGVVSACGNLGSLYLRGQGVAANPVRATELFREGAAQGHADSMYLLASSLEVGRGITKDSNEAARWYAQAAKLGNAEAAKWCLQAGVSY